MSKCSFRVLVSCTFYVCNMQYMSIYLCVRISFPVSLEAVTLNATLNNVDVETDRRDRIGSCAGQWDVVLLGDMFYDQDITDKVFDWLRYLTSRGTRVFIGDPGRVFLSSSESRLHRVATYQLPKEAMLENSGLTQGNAWTLKTDMLACSTTDCRWWNTSRYNIVGNGTTRLGEISVLSLRNADKQCNKDSTIAFWVSI